MINVIEETLDIKKKDSCFEACSVGRLDIVYEGKSCV
jgi:hypothetical protein